MANKSAKARSPVVTAVAPEGRVAPPEGAAGALGIAAVGLVFLDLDHVKTSGGAGFRPVNAQSDPQ
jgi:hypothetical protein